MKMTSPTSPLLSVAHDVDIVNAVAKARYFELGRGDEEDSGSTFAEKLKLTQLTDAERREVLA